MYDVVLRHLESAHIQQYTNELKQAVEWVHGKLPEMDSYHKVRRMALRAGGAYASMQPSPEGVYLVQIVSQDLRIAL